MVVVIALVLSVAFGAGDQYLGSMSWHPWAADVSLLSAPWILLAFLAGCTQRVPRRAALLGLACTGAALLGYGLMTLSPVENAVLTGRSAAGFVQSEGRVIVGALVTGPLFGWLGYRWRARGEWIAAIATASLLCLEPLARISAGDAIRFRAVWETEVAAGLALAVAVAVSARRTRGTRASR